ncbi:hypothetical protein CR513_22323, partial [Mucuna pruriens]
MTLIEAPKSNMASVKVHSLMVHGTKKIPGFLHFFGSACEVLVLNSSFLVKNDTTPPISLLPFIFLLLCTHNSLRKFAYLGICWIASRSGILISTFRNIFSSSSSDSGFLAEIFRDGNGKGISRSVGIACCWSSRIVGTLDCWLRAASLGPPETGRCLAAALLSMLQENESREMTIHANIPQDIN